MNTDVIVVGGGPAGLTAALVLARAGRGVVVVDEGSGRNAPAAQAHNVFTRDGASPEELRSIGRAQAQRYGAVFVDGQVVDAQANEDHVEARLEDGRVIEARRAILATGLVDELPEIPGLRAAWGRTAVHCPYCHGHELRGRATVVLGNGDLGFELSRLVTGWTDRVTLMTNGPAELGEDQRRILTERGIAVREEGIEAVAVEGSDVQAVLLSTGERIPCGALYFKPAQKLRGPLPDALGVERTETGLIRTDESGQTSVPVVYACGDAASPKQMVQLAAASGAYTGAMVNHVLVAEGVGHRAASGRRAV